MYLRPRICMTQNLRFKQMIERDVIHAESCYQEDGEEVRRQEARQEIRAQGRRQEGDAQRRGEESLREEELRQTDGGEEIRGQEGRRQEVGRETRAGQAKESRANNAPWIVGAVASRLIGLRAPTYRLIRRGYRRFGLA
jgi:hypothetical protein